jgi:hypothetical protein
MAGFFRSPCLSQAGALGVCSAAGLFFGEATLGLLADKALAFVGLPGSLFLRALFALLHLAFALCSLPLGKFACGLFAGQTLPFGLGANGFLALRLLFERAATGFGLAFGLVGGVAAGVFTGAACLFLLPLGGEQLLALGKCTFAGGLLARGNAVAQRALRRLIFHFAGDALAVDVFAAAAHFGVALCLFARPLVAFTRQFRLDARLLGHLKFAPAALLKLGGLTGRPPFGFMLHVIQLGIALDTVDRGLQLPALLRGGGDIGDILLAQSVFQRQTRGLVNAGTLLRIGTGADPLKSLSDGRFQTQMLMLLQRVAVF